MLTAWLKGPTEIHLWHGVADRAQERDVNLICFSGGIPHWHQQFEAQKNILFDLAGEYNVNGLLVWANILSHTLDRDNFKVFCQHYAPLPMISMGMLLPSLPSIRIDMLGGMRKLLSHLIEVHGRRRIAFLRGLEISQDAEDRYQAYCETLAEYGLPLDPALVQPGDFRRSSGTAAIEQLVDIQRTPFDALVSANDNMAIGAMQALQTRGVRIPEDIVVAGFDDIEETRAIVPSLTTIRAPWYQLGSQSVDLILSRLAGEPLPDEILLSTELVYRRSCGCQPLISAEPRTSPGDSRAVLPIPVNSRGASIIDSQTRLEAFLTAGLAAAISIPGLNEVWTRQLVNDFLSDVYSNEKASNHFLRTLGDGLDQIPSGAQVIEWQTVLEVFRSSPAGLFPTSKEHLKALDLIAGAYAAVGEIAHRRQLAQRLEVENQTDRLNRIVQSMATTYDMNALMQLLADELPGLGIQSCFLSLYAEQGNNP
ncbi:MAG TPA: substrate-binding domain-containing protein, partial [Rhodocyclaceae bacterium]